METFKVEIQELLSRTIDIEAQNIEEAIQKASNMYNSEEIILDYNDLTKREIIPNILLNEKENLTKEIIDYLYKDEKKHFEELEKPNNHIFSKIERLKTLVD
jgi:DpnD/PcfM-like protein